MQRIRDEDLARGVFQRPASSNDVGKQRGSCAAARRLDILGWGSEIQGSPASVTLFELLTVAPTLDPSHLPSLVPVGSRTVLLASSILNGAALVPLTIPDGC